MEQDMDFCNRTISKVSWTWWCVRVLHCVCELQCVRVLHCVHIHTHTHYIACVSSSACVCYIGGGACYIVRARVCQEEIYCSYARVCANERSTARTRACVPRGDLLQEEMYCMYCWSVCAVEVYVLLELS